MDYQTITHQIILGQLKLQINHITNFDDLLNTLIEKGESHEDYQDERLPYWADLWHSAIALGKYLEAKREINESTTVTEIGCGLGLPGIVCGMLGAKVTLTDYLPDALDFCKLNWDQNCKQAANFELLDWRQPKTELSADVLLASDVAYESRSFEALEATIELMVPVGGKIILSEPSREIAKPFIEKLLYKKGFESKLNVLKVNWDGFDKKVNIVEMKNVKF